MLFSHQKNEASAFLKNIKAKKQCKSVIMEVSSHREPTLNTGGSRVPKNTLNLKGKPSILQQAKNNIQVLRRVKAGVPLPAEE